ELVDSPVHRTDQVMNQLVRRSFRLGREVTGDIKATNVVPKCCNREVHAASPARLLLRSSRKDRSEEGKILAIESLRQIRRKSIKRSDQQLVPEDRQRCLPYDPRNALKRTWLRDNDIADIGTNPPRDSGEIKGRRKLLHLHKG